MSRDNVQISGAPASWRLRAATHSLLMALRVGRWLPSSDLVFLSISVVDKRQMAALNFRYRGKRKPTDVLSFEQKAQAGPKGMRFLGDIVLCREVVEEQSRFFGQGIRGEAVTLLAHGFFHLLGFDHERSARERKRMAEAESRLLVLAGFPAISSGLIGRAELKK